MNDKYDDEAETLLPCLCPDGDQHIYTPCHEQDCPAYYRLNVAAKLREQLKTEAERVTERDLKIIDDHYCQVKYCDCTSLLVEDVRTAQAKERGGELGK